MKRIIIIACCLFAVLIGIKVFLPQFKELFARPEISFTEHEQEKNIQLKAGQYLLFGCYNEEPILWRVLDVRDGNALLFSENVITFKAMNAADEHHRYGSSDYERSTIKQWLNSAGTVQYTQAVPSKENVYLSYNAYEEEPGFLSACNFTDAQRELIVPESVCLLDESAIKQYVDEDERIKYPSAGALKQDNAPFIRPAAQGVWYFTASANDYSSMSVVAVTSSGGFYKTPANDGTCGIAPAMTLKTITPACAGGEGTKNSPYYVAID